MVPGCDGGLHVELTVNVCTGPEPHALFATTLNEAFTAALLKLITTLAEPCPVFTDAPDIAVHV